MSDSDFTTVILILLIAVIALLLAPPGPGTPLQSPTRS